MISGPKWPNWIWTSCTKTIQLSTSNVNSVNSCSSISDLGGGGGGGGKSKKRFSHFGPTELFGCEKSQDRLAHFGPTQRSHILTDFIYPLKPEILLRELTFEVESWLVLVQKVQIQFGHFGPLILCATAYQNMSLLTL